MDNTFALRMGGYAQKHHREFFSSSLCLFFGILNLGASLATITCSLVRMSQSFLFCFFGVKAGEQWQRESIRVTEKIVDTLQSLKIPSNNETTKTTTTATATTTTTTLTTTCLPTSVEGCLSLLRCFWREGWMEQLFNGGYPFRGIGEMELLFWTIPCFR